MQINNYNNSIENNKTIDMNNYNILKTYCKYILYVGSGNFWYEEKALKDDKHVFYRLFRFILLFMYAMLTVLEIMAAVLGDFPEDEKSDSVTFAVSHTIVMIKIFSVTTKKQLMKELNLKMVEICKPYEERSLMGEKYKAIKINVIAYFGIVYVCATCFVLEGLRKLYSGSHFVAVVTYYPPFNDDSVLATSFRIFTTIVLYIMMMTMIVSVDTFSLAHLLMYKYKFITLRHYFEGLRVEFDRSMEAGDRDTAEIKLAEGLVEGIQMHDKLLRLTKDIDKAFGTVMALQLCQSSGSAVSLLLQMAIHSADLTIVAVLKIILFVFGLFLLLALFLCNAGEITYQASLLSDSIFYCGWHMCTFRHKSSTRYNIRRLVLFGVMQAQRPLVMKAFKMMELTYATFLLVVRGTYSVFALFYAQND